MITNFPLISAKPSLLSQRATALKCFETFPGVSSLCFQTHMCLYSYLTHYLGGSDQRISMTSNSCSSPRSSITTGILPTQIPSCPYQERICPCLSCNSVGSFPFFLPSLNSSSPYLLQCSSPVYNSYLL